MEEHENQNQPTTVDQTTVAENSENKENVAENCELDAKEGEDDESAILKGEPSQGSGGSSCIMKICICVVPIIIIMVWYDYYKSFESKKRAEEFLPCRIPPITKPAKICFQNQKIFYQPSLNAVRQSVGSHLYLKIDPTGETLQKEKKGAKSPQGFYFKGRKQLWALVNDRVNQKTENRTSKQIPSKPSQWKSTITIMSQTFRRSQPELWFTKMHIHDKGAVMGTLSLRNFKYFIPGYTKKFGYAPNRLVSRDQEIQTERGIKYVYLDAKNYKSNKTQCMQVLSEEMDYTEWWKNFYWFQALMLCLSVLKGYYTDLADFSVKKSASLRRVLIVYTVMIMRTLDIYSDFFYMITYPHKDALTAALLLFNWMLPHWTILIINNIFYDSFHPNTQQSEHHKNEEKPPEPIATSYWEWFSGFLSWSRQDPGIINEKAKAKTKLLVATPHKVFRVYLFYQDNLSIGTTWNNVILVQPLNMLFGMMAVFALFTSSITKFRIGKASGDMYDPNAQGAFGSVWHFICSINLLLIVVFSTILYFFNRNIFGYFFVSEEFVSKTEAFKKFFRGFNNENTTREDLGGTQLMTTWTYVFFWSIAFLYFANFYRSGRKVAKLRELHAYRKRTILMRQISPRQLKGRCPVRMGNLGILTAKVKNHTECYLKRRQVKKEEVDPDGKNYEGYQAYCDSLFHRDNGREEENPRNPRMITKGKKGECIKVCDSCENPYLEGEGGDERNAWIAPKPFQDDNCLVFCYLCCLNVEDNYKDVDQDGEWVESEDDDDEEDE